MSYEFPPAVLFPTIVRCARAARTPRVDGSLGEWRDEYLLPPLHELAGGEGHARLCMAWNEGGLYFAVRVPRTRPVVVNRQHPASGDSVELFIDVRAGQTGHRATQFCYYFWALPGGGGPDRSEAIIQQAHLRRALRRAPLADADDLRVAARQGDDCYALEVGLPADALVGLEPGPGARLAVAMVVHDLEHGPHYWGTSRDFPYARDPSTWGMVELVGG